MKLLLSIIVMLFFSTCTQANTDQLVVGMELAYPPFETRDSNGDPMGVSVELARALGEYLGKEVVIENTAWAGLIPALQTGKVDMVISSMSITEDRKQQVDFSSPYAKANMVILANVDAPINSLDDLNQQGMIVAVQQGATPHIFATKYLTNTTVQTFTSRSVATTEVVQGKAQATIYDMLTAFQVQQTYPNETKIVPFTVSDPKMIDDLGLSWGAAVKKGNTQLLEDINKFLVEYRENGGFNNITQKFLSEEKKIFDDYGMEFFF